MRSISSSQLVEQAELDLFGVVGEQGEVDAHAVPGGAQADREPPAKTRRWSPESSASLLLLYC